MKKLREAWHDSVLRILLGQYLVTKGQMINEGLFDNLEHTNTAETAVEEADGIRLDITLPELEELFRYKGWLIPDGGTPSAEEIAHFLWAMAEDLDDDEEGNVTIQGQRFVLIKQEDFPTTYTVALAIGSVDRDIATEEAE